MSSHSIALAVGSRATPIHEAFPQMRTPDCLKLLDQFREWTYE